ncbi:MAG: ABC transporter substrate-binding protein [Gammaproteobacteria bacterium]|nr:ABC transporter substrate-binding protein [Gammaproteobacteria bacterium]
MRYLFIFLLAFPLGAFADECPRIISQSPYISKTLDWMGLKECIVGTSRYDTLGLPTTGGVSNPDKAAIDDLMPDIILTSDRTKPETLAAITPKGATAYRLYGFQSMAQIEANMRTIATVVHRPELAGKADEFHKLWIDATKQIQGNGKKVLLISSCSGMPYSFGKNTWLYDLFSHAGFEVVETAERIRHIRPGNEIAEITQLLDTLKPELLFIFQRKLSPQCQMLTPKVPIRIYSFDGANFLYPAPALLDGLQKVRKLNKFL